MSQRWETQRYFPPPQSLSFELNHYKYVVNVRITLPGEEFIDLEFSGSAGFGARHFENTRWRETLLSLWADVYMDRCNRTAVHELNELRYTAAASLSPAQAAATISDSVYPSGLISRLCDAARDFHERRRAQPFNTWRPSHDAFTRVYQTPEQLMHALLAFEGDRNPVVQTIRHIVRGVRQLTFVDQLPNQGRDTIRAQFDALWPTPDLEQSCAFERVMNEHVESRGFRDQYESRWDVQDARAALLTQTQQRAFLPEGARLTDRRVRELTQRLTEQAAWNALSTLTGGVEPAPVYPFPEDIVSVHEQATRAQGRWAVDLARGPDMSLYQRALYGEWGIVRRSADVKAEKLLRESLSADQLAQLDATSSFDVRGGETGRTYRICWGTQMNVFQLDKRGRRVRGLCFVPEGGLAAGDVMLTQKIALELREKEALATANTF
jgi:hypothetical protein